MSHLPPRSADRVIVVGAGVAGLSTALRLAQRARPAPVTLVAAAPLGTGAATGWAQGGIAAVIDDDDRPALHAADTRVAGAGLTDPEVAHRVAEAGPGVVAWLVRQGVAFDRDATGALALGLEAAHSRRRIVRAGGDATGRSVLDGLVRAVRSHPGIEVLVASVHDLMRDANGAVRGVVCARDGVPFRLPARSVVLATGGVGGLYGATTNPRTALGGGLLVAARAGASLRDVEFVQFHPTAIVSGRDPMPLATEALRGEGAVLIDAAGERVTAGIAGGDLAPRDVVARAIFAALERGPVYLDARGALGRGIRQRFPTVAALCAEAGIDPASQPIPVRPAAHYHMGGIRVDAVGRSDVPGLWACGECASTGLHGANRLASNSLLEALAYAAWIADAMEPVAEAAPVESPASLPARAPAGGGALAEVRAIMDRHVGVARDAPGLERAVARLAALAGEGCEAALTALMIARAALARRESRGAHWRADYTETALPRHAVTTLDETFATGDTACRAAHPPELSDA